MGTINKTFVSYGIAVSLILWSNCMTTDIKIEKHINR
jgi:hypothetical protein